MITDRTSEVRQKNTTVLEQDFEDSEKDITFILVDELHNIMDPNELHKKIQELPDDRIGNNFKMFFTEKLYNMHKMDNSNLYDDIKSVSSLKFISNRHKELVDLNESVIELQKLFIDLAVLVREQDRLFGDIESNVGKAMGFVEKAKKDMKTATVYQKKSRRKMKTVLGSIIGIIGTIGVPTAVVLAKK